MREPDEIPDDEFDRLDPSCCSPVVAWLASQEAGHVSGQVIRAMGEKIHLMGGWTEDVTLSNGGARWDATKLGDLFATDLFKTRAPGAPRRLDPSEEHRGELIRARQASRCGTSRSRPPRRRCRGWR